MMIILLIIAVVVVGAPLLAVGVVSIAVFREGSRHSIIGGAPGVIDRGVRRVLAFHSEASCEPFSQADAWRLRGLSGERARSDEFPYGAESLLGAGHRFDDRPRLDDEPIAAGGGSPWRSGR